MSAISAIEKKPLLLIFIKGEINYKSSHRNIGYYQYMALASFNIKMMYQIYLIIIIQLTII